MQYYFQLQVRRIFRWLEMNGINPIVGMVIAALIFIIMSMLLFYKTVYAVWIYVFAYGYLASTIRDPKADLLISKSFSKKTSLTIRFLENAALALPFIIYLAYEKNLIGILTIIGLMILSSVITHRIKTKWLIPTPFKRRPFEFIIGFRKYFWLIALLYILLIMGIRVDNYNLCVGSLGFLMMVAMSFVYTLEHRYFVWIYHYDADGFLKYKSIQALICCSIISLPALIALLVCFPLKIIVSIIVYIIGHLILTTAVITKYSAFPNEVKIPQAILYGMGLAIPLLLPWIMWKFYIRARQNLNVILK